MARCKYCRVSVNEDNLRKHYASVHPKMPTPETPAPRRDRRPVTRRTKNIAKALSVIAVIVALAVVLSGQHVGQGQFPFPCVNSDPLLYHWHPTLAIRDASGQVTIPAQIGISVTCMEPIHTHDTSGTIHVETDVNRLYTVGDFLKVWGKPFGSPTQMLVNGTAVTPTPDRTLYDQESISLTYSGAFT